MDKRQLVEELIYSIHIQTADDIYRCKQQRPEYQLYVSIAEAFKVPKEDIPTLVLGMLMAETIKQESSILFKLKRYFYGLKKRIKPN